MKNRRNLVFLYQNVGALVPIWALLKVISAVSPTPFQSTTTRMHPAFLTQIEIGGSQSVITRVGTGFQKSIPDIGFFS